MLDDGIHVDNVVVGEGLLSLNIQSLKIALKLHSIRSICNPSLDQLNGVMLVLPRQALYSIIYVLPYYKSLGHTSTHLIFEIELGPSRISPTTNLTNFCQSVLHQQYLYSILG